MITIKIKNKKTIVAGGAIIALSTLSSWLFCGYMKRGKHIKKLQMLLAESNQQLDDADLECAHLRAENKKLKIAMEE